MVAGGYLGWSVLVHPKALSVFACLLASGAGYVGACNGLEWRYRTERLRVKDRDYFGYRWVNRAPEGGFASQVDHSFTHYFNRYVPKGADRDVWLAETTDIRNTLRDEVVELYRESRIRDVEPVNWLIRHLVSDIRKRWETGTLLGYREYYRIAPSTKVWCLLSLAALVLAAVDVVIAAIQTHPILAAVATLAAVSAGPAATIRWLRIISERRRYAEDWREYEQRSEARQTAYQRWKERLDSTRPTEREMEAWLNCDKTKLLDYALRHYRLAWREVIAHAFLQTPARKCKRARVIGGLWRYSKYEMRLFLITQDGVREVIRELDFEQASFNSQERNNFRFDAVSSVHVTKTGEHSPSLELTLMNGPTRKILVTPEVSQADYDEDPATFSEINLDAAGFAHTLHILEGIAAEGKSWIGRAPHVNGNSGDPAPTVEELDASVSRDRPAW